MELFLYVGAALFFFFFIRKYKSTERFFVRLLGRLVVVPFIGNGIQSIVARLEYEKHEEERRALKLSEQKNLAINSRKLLRRVQVGDNEPLVNTPRYQYKVRQKGKTASSDVEKIIKTALILSTSSHNRVSVSAPPTNISTKQLEQVSYFSYKFQREEKYREPFNLLVHDVLGAEEDDRTRPIEINDIAKDLALLSTTPNVKFLWGPIGSGKSTVAAIISAEIQRNLNKNPKRLPIKIVTFDFEQIVEELKADSSIIRHNTFLEFVYRKLKEQGHKATEATLVEHLNSSNKNKYIFVFDNLDIVYSEFCRYFVSEDDLKLIFFGQDNYLHCLTELIRAFTDLKTTSSPLAPSAIFCLRGDTIELLQARFDKLGYPMLGIGNDIIELTDEEEQGTHFVNILKGRFKLTKDMLVSKSIPEEVRNNFKSVYKHYKLQPDALVQFVDLSVQGKRSATQAVTRCFRARYSSKKIAKALSDVNRVKTLALFNGYEEYAQDISNIANLFLVNSEYRIVSEKADLPHQIKLPGYFHVHTYWLKYLVFAYIAFTNERDGSTDLTEAEQLFCEIGKFDTSLFRLVIYSLTEVRHGRLVRPKISNIAQRGRFINLTSRGKVFKENDFELIWSFPYLATILEDEWMELPKIIAEKRKNFGSRALWDDSDYVDYLIDKLWATIEYAVALEVTLEFEVANRPTLFAELAKSGFDQYSFPEFERIRSNLIEHVRSAVSQLNNKKAIERTESEIRQLQIKLENGLKKEITEQLEALYAYQLPED